MQIIRGDRICTHATPMVGCAAVLVDHHPQRIADALANQVAAFVR